jgi:hypothetical protein
MGRTRIRDRKVCGDCPLVFLIKAGGRQERRALKNEEGKMFGRAEQRTSASGLSFVFKVYEYGDTALRLAGAAWQARHATSIWGTKLTFALGPRTTSRNLDRVTRSQDFQDTYKLVTSSSAFKYLQETKWRSSNMLVIYFKN